MAPTQQRSTASHNPDVYFVGLRWPQHATVSGYDAIVKHLGKPVQLPIVNRWPWKDAADRRVQPRRKYWLTEQLSRILERCLKPTYSLPLLRMELAVARHMLFRRRAVYHVLYGETDVCLLGFFGRITGNYVVASFHDGRAVLEGCGVSGWLLRSLTAVVVLGSCQREFFLQHIPAERIHVIPHGVDTSFFAPATSERGTTPEYTQEPLVLTVGGHTRDYRTLSQAFDAIRTSLPTARFVAVSANVGNKGARLPEAGIEHLSGVSDEQLRALYQRATVAVFSFEYAVANNAILEALACGTPVVATDIGAVREYVDARSGVLTAPCDAHGISQAVVDIVTDDRVRQRMAMAARQTAESFAWEHVCAVLSACYRTITGSAREPLPASACSPTHDDQISPAIPTQPTRT